MVYRHSHTGVNDHVIPQEPAGNGAGRKGKSKAAHPGKRLKHDESGEADAGVGGSKKNRHAFCDVTNQEIAPPATSRRRADECKEKDRQGVEPNFQAGPRHFLNECGYGTAITQPQPSVKELDVQDELEVFSCATYAAEIYHNLFESEKLRRPSTTYMESFQTDLSPQMRTILVDWMVEVAVEYELVSDTLFLAVSFVDRYLSQAQIARGRLQLVGVTCMLIAAKYEEIYAPQIEEFCFITENTYTKQEIIVMESDILDSLKFECTTPTPKQFVRRFCRAAESDVPDDRLQCLASYLTELALPEYSALQFLPSQVAAAAVMVAGYTLARTGWTPTLQHYTRCLARELRAPALLLYRLFAGARTAPVAAVRDKYSHPRHKCVASVSVPDVLPESLFLEPGLRTPSVLTPPRLLEPSRLLPEWSATSLPASEASLASLVGSGGSGAIKAYHGIH